MSHTEALYIELYVIYLLHFWKSKDDGVDGDEDFFSNEAQVFNETDIGGFSKWFANLANFWWLED